MNGNTMLTSKYADKIEAIEKYVNNWNDYDLDRETPLIIVDEENGETIVVANAFSFGDTKKDKFALNLRNKYAAGRVWFHKGDDIHEVFDNVRCTMIKNK